MAVTVETGYPCFRATHQIVQTVGAVDAADETVVILLPYAITGYIVRIYAAAGTLNETGLGVTKTETNGQQSLTVVAANLAADDVIHAIVW